MVCVCGTRSSFKNGAKSAARSDWRGSWKSGFLMESGMRDSMELKRWGSAFAEATADESGFRTAGCGGSDLSAEATEGDKADAEENSSDGWHGEDEAESGENSEKAASGA